jgi:hypothetical protein
LDDSWQSEDDKIAIDDRCKMYELILRNIFEWSEAAIAECVADRRRDMTRTSIALGTELHEYPGYLLIRYVLPRGFSLIFDPKSRLKFESDFTMTIHQHFYNEFVDPNYDWVATKKRVFDFLAQHGIEPIKK